MMTDEEYEKIFDQFKVGEFDPGYSALSEHLGQFPDNPKSNYAMGVYWAVMDNEEAFGKSSYFFEKSISSGFVNPNAYYNLCHVYVKQGRLAEAKPFLEVFLADHPTDPIGSYYLASIYASQDQFEQIRPLVPALVQMATDNPNLLNELSRMFRRLELTEELGWALNHVSRLLPDQKDVLMDYAQFLHEQGRLDEELTEIEKIISLVPDDEGAFLCKQTILGELGRFEEIVSLSLERLQKVQTFENRNFWLGHLGFAYCNIGNYESAEALYRQQIEANSRVGNYWGNLALTLHKQHRDQEAVECYLNATRLEPDDPIWAGATGDTYRRLGDDANAEHFYQQALTIDPGNKTVLNNYGHLLSGQKRDAEACALYKEVLEKAPAQQGVAANYGYLLLKQGRVAEGIQMLRTAVRNDQDDIASFLALAQALTNYQNDLLSAFEVLDHGNTLHSSPWLTAIKGVICLNFDLLDDAEIALRQTIHNHPGFAAAYGYLGIALIAGDKIIEAQAALAEGQRRNGTDTSVLTGLGALAFKQERYESAYDYLNRALQQKEHPQMILSALFQLPSTANPDKFRHFYHHNHLTFSETRNSQVMLQLQFAIDAGATAIIERFFRSAINHFPSELSGFSNAIDSACKFNRQFNEAMKGWDNEPGNRETVLLNKAVILYHLGDPVSAYRIMNFDLDSRFIKNNIKAIYYYVLLTWLVEENPARMQSLAMAANALSANATFEETYYLSIIFELAGDYEQAILSFLKIGPYYRPANYRLAVVLKRLADGQKYPAAGHLIGAGLTTREALDQLMSELQILEYAQPFYKFGLSPVIVSGRSTSFLAEIESVTKFIDVVEIVSELFAMPHELGFTFASHIKFAPVSRPEVPALAKLMPLSWKKLAQEVKNDERISEIVRSLMAYSSPMAKLAEQIRIGATQEWADRHLQVKKVYDFKFRDYAIVVACLYQENRLSASQSSELMFYIQYCISQLPAVKTVKDKLKVYFSELIVDFVVDKLEIPFLDLIKKTIALGKIIRGDSEPSAIMEFSAFSATLREDMSQSS